MYCVWPSPVFLLIWVTWPFKSLNNRGWEVPQSTWGPILPQIFRCHSWNRQNSSNHDNIRHKKCVFISLLGYLLPYYALMIKEVMSSIVVGINAYNFDTVITSADIDWLCLLQTSFYWKLLWMSLIFCSFPHFYAFCLICFCEALCIFV